MTEFSLSEDDRQFILRRVSATKEDPIAYVLKSSEDPLRTLARVISEQIVLDRLPALREEAREEARGIAARLVGRLGARVI